MQHYENYVKDNGNSETQKQQEVKTPGQKKVKFVKNGMTKAMEIALHNRYDALASEVTEENIPHDSTEDRATMNLKPTQKVKSQQKERARRDNKSVCT